MAERVHRDAGAEVEISLTRVSDQPHALAPLESKVGTRKNRHQCGRHVIIPQAELWPKKRRGAAPKSSTSVSADFTALEAIVNHRQILGNPLQIQRSRRRFGALFPDGGENEAFTVQTLAGESAPS
ncbi:hypothetical protein IZ6_26930 [Terrihabitans soli]|uniref:Uncharacterized protein n=1 Tax=Terrihabitans soli TaxID=708113 RepID=A0A6S6QZ97_9HYPH|nr:hypothetical protein IZ6_26930 [Terrihabitans soli]